MRTVLKVIALLVVALVIGACKPTVDGGGSEVLTPTPGIVYVENGDGTASVGNNQSFEGTEVVIASTYNGLPVTEIENYAFLSNATLETIIIPATIETIENQSFGYCFSLRKIICSENNIAFSSKDGVLYNKAKTELIVYPAAKKDSSKFVIPNSVKEIKEWAFYRCSTLTKVEIPSTVEKISMYAFAYCTEVTSFTIPSSVSNVEYLAFLGCASMMEVKILPGEKEVVLDRAFEGCTALESITIPNNVKTLGDRSFFGCSALETVFTNYTKDNYPDTWLNTENEPFFSADWVSIP